MSATVIQKTEAQGNPQSSAGDIFVVIYTVQYSKQLKNIVWVHVIGIKYAAGHICYSENHCICDYLFWLIKSLREQIPVFCSRIETR